MTTATLAIRAFVLAVLASLATFPTLAQNPGDPAPGSAPFGLFSFDEKGGSLLNGGANPNPVLPVAGGGLQFILPTPVVPGQVLIISPTDVNSANPNGDSDLLTFSNVLNPNGTPAFGVMLYESLFDQDAYDLTANDPADVLRLSFQVPFTGGSILETPGEGLNNFTYNTSLGNSYFGWSDGYLPTPEPSTFVLGVLGLLGLAALAYRRRRHSTMCTAVLLLVLVAFGSSRSALAQAIGQPIAAVPPFTLDFDEKGSSLLNGGANPNGFNILGGGGIQFFLPGMVQPGQVLITNINDANTSPNGDSDLLTFTNGPGLNGAVTGIMLYESLFDAPEPLLPADVPNLNFLAPILTINENGPEGNNDFFYIVPGATYHGISDGFLRTPEPSTLVLGGLGLLSLAALAYRRRHKSKLIVAGLLLAMMALGSAEMALAQQPGSPLPGNPGFTFSFDEQGNSLLNGAPNPNPVIYFGGGPGIPGGIQFVLPVPVVTGDVLVRGLSDAPVNGISDLLQFSNNTTNQGLMTYLSLIDDNDPNPDAADHPTFPITTTFGTTEFGPEGANQFLWTPDPSTNYVGYSDGLLPTPEPSTLVLAGLGFLALGAFARRRRRARSG